ncbi:cell wall protein DAN4-like [Acipenser oxyrinchus oxyrinchus]|uniref:Cell wall protein DAN4-like n=1 Tax=Acipenser oxyrinchus oxyrinchus TaxID=40147 RepID=A0AAD8CTH7_ACIOX|nr:cell wall protein DAN4-like [Acipenser oxyrinchus oxyrinchus]
MAGSKVHRVLVLALAFILGSVLGSDVEPSLNSSTANPSTTGKSSTVQLTAVSSSTITPTPITPSASPPSSTVSTTSSSSPWQLFEPQISLLVMGGLVLLCTILFITTCILANVVCSLRRSYRMTPRPTNSNANLLSSSNFGASGGANPNGKETVLSETSIMMEEVKTETAQENREQEKQTGTVTSAGAKEDESQEATATAGTPPEERMGSDEKEDDLPPPPDNSTADFILVV